MLQSYILPVRGVLLNNCATRAALVVCQGTVMSLSFALLLASLLLLPALAVRLDVDDSVLESGRLSTDAVLLSVAYVQQAAIFADHSELLQRIAYVETRDGTDREAFNEGMNGGIWAVREDAFTSTQSGSDPFSFGSVNR